MSISLSRKNAIQFIQTRPEFQGVNVEALPMNTVNFVCERIGGTRNQEWLDLIVRALTLNSDGFPRYIYVGELMVNSDGQALNINYRGLSVYSSASLEYGIQNIILFDDPTPLITGTNIYWNFKGYMIDRGA